MSSNVPVQVGSDLDWVDVQSYGATVCGLKSTGKVHCWGEGFEGTYGDAPAWRVSHHPVVIP